MGMSSGGGGGLNSEINVTPMVDIMLVLLIIFMLVTPQLQQGITVEIPKETSNAEDDKAISSQDSLVISIPNDGEFYLGKVKYNIDLKNKNECVFIVDGVETPAIALPAGAVVIPAACLLNCPLRDHLHSGLK